MTRKFLEDLGFTKEQIDQTLDAHSQEIGRLKSDLEKAQNKLQAVEADFSKFQEEKAAEIEQLKTDAKNQEKTRMEELTKLKVENAVEIALTKENAKNSKAVRALLNLEGAQLQEDGSVKGLSEQLEALKKSDGYLFGSLQTQIRGAKPGESGNEELNERVDTAKMTYSELVKYMAEHPDFKLE